MHLIKDEKDMNFCIFTGYESLHIKHDHLF